MKLFNRVIDANRVWVTSDWHLNHTNICREISGWPDKSGCREFPSLDEMNNKIIDETNNAVPSDGILINLGDILFGSKQLLPDFLDRVNCKEHHYILGNHDHWMIDGNESEFKKDIQQLFSSMQFYLELFARMPDGSKRRVCFNHFSSRVWHDSHKGSILCWGHSHSSLGRYGKSLDVGVDTNDFKPYLLSDIIEWSDEQPVIEIDHHHS